MPLLLCLTITGLDSLLIFVSLLCFSFLCLYSFEVLEKTSSQERQLRSLLLDFVPLTGSPFTLLYPPFLASLLVSSPLLFCPFEDIGQSAAWFVCLWRCSAATVRKDREQNWHVLNVSVLHPGMSEESERVESASETGGESSAKPQASAISKRDGGSLQPAC